VKKAKASMGVSPAKGSTAPSIPMAMAGEKDDPDRAPDKYEIEDGVRTLQRADEIKNNKKLMPHIQKHIGKQITSLKGLRKLAQDKMMAPDKDEDGM
jgi:hypothetical protein